MAEIVRLPGVSADAEHAVIDAWLVSPGQGVRRGEAVASIETDKAIVDIESPTDGVVYRLLVDAQTSAAVGQPIAIVLQAGEGEEAGAALAALLDQQAGPADAQGSADAAPVPGDVSEPAAAPGLGDALEQAAAPRSGDAAQPAAAEAPPTRTFASPLARRLAREAGLELSALTGTGPGGRIVRADVHAALADSHTHVPEPGAAAQPAAQPAAGSDAHATASGTGGDWVEPVSRVRAAVAARLSESKAHVPHFYLRRHLRADALVRLQADLAAAQVGVRITLGDLFLAAAARALAACPDLNVTWGPDGVRHHSRVDVAVAIASQRGLVTPVVRGADQLRLGELATQMRNLIERANAGQLRQHELEGGALTVSNLGMYGVDDFDAIINPPQAAILALGAVRDAAVVGPDGGLEVGKVITASLSVDHRPVDGVVGARWLDAFAHLVHHPLRLLV